MPELPEVETTRRGIEQGILNKTISNVIIRQSKLRWPITPQLNRKLQQHTIQAVNRRSKVLLLECDHGTLLVHLGMTGCLRILDPIPAAQKHDHVDILFTDGSCLRYSDPRRFGAILWTQNASEHFMLSNLGPEPLSADFTDDHLYQQSRQRRVPVKQFIMDNKVVVGVGNIYATEALFKAGIHPMRAANRISQARYQTLSHAICEILTAAIKAGGTTLKDFYNSEGKPGYFRHKLLAYGRDGQACVNCQTTLKKVTLGQRSSVYCPSCQK